MESSYTDPAYRALFESGELQQRADTAAAGLQHCCMCPQTCGANRLAGAEGAACGISERALVASYGPHFGEERPLSGTQGSGTVFFSSCNLSCVFCQNWDISQQRFGREVSAEELGGIMLKLQESGCHNINLVSPTHVAAQFLQALCQAAAEGLRLPIVYNSGGFDSVETLRLLDGVVDIYMPDMKFGNSDTARKYTGVDEYVCINRDAVVEMHRQVGDLVVDARGVAVRGLLVRHLVLPGDLAGTAEVLRFLAEELSLNTYLNLMDQYRPCYRAGEYPELEKSLSREEFQAARAQAQALGLQRLD